MEGWWGSPPDGTLKKQLSVGDCDFVLDRFWTKVDPKVATENTVNFSCFYQTPFQ
jgi:hypothetical protein